MYINNNIELKRLYINKINYLLEAPPNIHLEKSTSTVKIWDSSLVNNSCKLIPSCL